MWPDGKPFVVTDEDMEYASVEYVVRLTNDPEKARRRLDEWLAAEGAPDDGIVSGPTAPTLHLYRESEANEEIVDVVDGQAPQPGDWLAWGFAIGYPEDFADAAQRQDGGGPDV